MENDMNKALVYSTKMHEFFCVHNKIKCLLTNEWAKGCLAEFGVSEKVRWMGALEDEVEMGKKKIVIRQH